MEKEPSPRQEQEFEEDAIKMRAKQIFGVARAVQRKEMMASKKALAVKDMEWGKLWNQKVWDASVVKSWSQVAYEARSQHKDIHLEKLFGISVEKGSELPVDDERRKYKHGVVFQGNRVVDQYWEKALFQDLGSAPATMEAARTCIMHGLMPGNEIMQADAMQAYVQARRGSRYQKKDGQKHGS